jgi:hypothetical protein
MANSAMTLVNSLMGQASKQQRLKESTLSAGTSETPVQKAYKARMDKAAKDGNYGLLLALAKEGEREGVPTAPYLVEAKQASPVEWAISEALFPSKETQKTGKSPFARSDVAFNTPESMPQPRMSRREEIIKDIFDDDFVARVMTKKRTGVDIGNRVEDERWFEDYYKIKQSNPNLPAVEIKQALAGKYGYIPQTAAQLKDLPLEERQAITSRHFFQLINDPELRKQVKEMFPNGEEDKTIAGFALHYLSREGNPISPDLQVFLDRFNGLHDDKIELEAQKQSAITEATTGAKIHAEYEGRGKSAATAAAQTAATTEAQLSKKFEMEPLTPISAADKAKHGIGSQFQTYEQLADAGFRFASETDRKDYSDIIDLVSFIDNILWTKEGDPGLIQKIFTSGDDYASRFKHGLVLQKAKAFGDPLGIDVQTYESQLGLIVKKMLSMVERGGKFSDFDAKQVQEALPKADLFSPSGKTLAKNQLETARILLSKKLEYFKKVAVEPMGQPNTSTTTPTTGKPAPETSGESPPPAPQGAIEYLKRHPELKDAFKKKYGYLPEGF